MGGGNVDIGRMVGTEGWVAIDPARLEGVLPRRVLAYAIDLCIVGLLVIAVSFFLLGATILTIGLLSPGFALLSLVPATYHTLTIAQGGATWGQRLFGLVVCDRELRPASLLQALVTTVVFYLTVPPTAGLVLLLVFLLPRRCTLHDLLSGTQVLRRAPPLGEVLPPRLRA
jgi:uncharacterized RDD family membrane protein YckC